MTIGFQPYRRQSCIGIDTDLVILNITGGNNTQHHWTTEIKLGFTTFCLNTINGNRRTLVGKARNQNLIVGNIQDSAFYCAVTDNRTRRILNQLIWIISSHEIHRVQEWLNILKTVSKFLDSLLDLLVLFLAPSGFFTNLVTLSL